VRVHGTAKRLLMMNELQLRIDLSMIDVIMSNSSSVGGGGNIMTIMSIITCSCATMLVSMLPVFKLITCN
jgi:formiminotetrahydrofolate cyclodeaminase